MFKPTILALLGVMAVAPASASAPDTLLKGSPERLAESLSHELQAGAKISGILPAQDKLVQATKPTEDWAFPKALQPAEDLKAPGLIQKKAIPGGAKTDAT